MKNETFLEGKRSRAAAAPQGLRLRVGGAERGIFTFEEKRTTDLAPRTCGRAREGAE
jgi:hypothetical protein